MNTWPKWAKWSVMGFIIAFVVLILAPALLRTFALGMKGEFDPKVNSNITKQMVETTQEKDAEIAKLKATLIDPVKCEFVLTPHRDDTFLRCPVPKDVRIPNWPDKVAPLNKGK